MSKSSFFSKFPLGLQHFLSFFISWKFRIHIGIALLLVISSYFLVNWYLGWTTNHSESTTVPDLKGLSIEKMTAKLSDKNLRYSIVDSIFSREGERGVVLDQDPKPEALVKHRRTIYVTVSRKMREMVQMPNLIDKSSRHAASVCEIRGLKIKKITTQPSDYCTGCVIRQLYKGEEIAARTPVPYGANITLVVGQAQGNQKVPVPDLKGLTIDEAKQRLNERSLNLGAEVYKDCLTAADSVAARIYKQSPGFNKFGVIGMGSAIDVWLRLLVDPALFDSIPPSR